MIIAGFLGRAKDATKNAMNTKTSIMKNLSVAGNFVAMVVKGTVAITGITMTNRFDSEIPDGCPIAFDFVSRNQTFE